MNRFAELNKNKNEKLQESEEVEREKNIQYLHISWKHRITRNGNCKEVTIGTFYN